MKVLTVYAHPNPKSFCHAVLERFTTGLREAGHTVEVVDLYAIKFDPVFRTRDLATYLHENIPPDILAAMNLEQQVLENVPGGPVGRFVAARWLRGKSPQQIAKFIREHARRMRASSGRRLTRLTGWRSSHRCSGCTFRRSSRAGSSACSPTGARTSSRMRAGRTRQRPCAADAPPEGPRHQHHAVQRGRL